MSRLRMVEQASAPDTPGTNEVVVYVNASGELCTKNDAGTVQVASPYTSGSWTPALDFGGATTGITYTSRWGLYCKVGAICFFEGAIVLSSKGSATGLPTISGLPYTARNQANGYPPVTINWINMTTSLVYMVGTVLLNTSTFVLGGIAAAAVTVPGLTEAALGNSTELRFSGAYIV
jgi:hypothetical protein